MIFLKKLVRQVLFVLFKLKKVKVLRLTPSNLPSDIELLEDVSEKYKATLRFIDKYEGGRIILPNIPVHLQKGTFALPPDYTGDAVFCVLNGQVKGKIPVGYTSKGSILQDTISYSDLDDRFTETMKINALTCLEFFKYKTQNESLDYACIMFNNWNHYGHWILEHALKLMYLSKIQDKFNVRIKLIMEEGCPQWKLDILSHLGWGNDDIFYWQGRPVHVEQLIVPNYPFGTQLEYKWLASRLSKSHGVTINRVTQTRIYLSRDKLGSRCVANESELVQYLEANGFTTIYPEEMTIRAQIEVFTNAEIIVGPHGSAFTNLIYSSNCQVVEFFGATVPLFFYKIAKIMGLNYSPLYCVSGKNKDDKMLVDIKQLELLLKK